MLIVHITTVHQRYDNRIYLKECRSLAANGFEVMMIVADGKGEETKDGVSFVDIGKSNSRLSRIFLNWIKALRKAWGLKAGIYHLHDPELIFLGTLLSLCGRNVVYDSHEDTAVQILAKPYLGNFSRKFFSVGYEFVEKNLARLFSGVVSASPLITSKFASVNSHVETISNFPIPGMFNRTVEWEERDNSIVYVGGISKNRGFSEVLEALQLSVSQPRFYLGGNFESEQFRGEIEATTAWKQTDYRGYVYPAEYVEMTSKSRIGINMAYPCDNYLDAFATKMFDYMDSGIPFICSNFEKWTAFVDKYECGIAVDPTKPEDIAAAIDLLLNDPEKSRRMGQNGQKAIDRKFNWRLEEAKLIAFYTKILDADKRLST